jgi:hypothetical protein
MKSLITTLVLLGGALPAVFGSPSPQNSRYCSRYPNRKECKTSTTVLPTPTPTPATTSTTSVIPTPTASGCTGGPFLITSFTWFNSSANLDCPLASDPEGLCLTGKPTQPSGYGPPDYVSFTVQNAATSRSSACIYQNPGSVPATGEPGRAGLTKCSTGDQSFIFTFTAGPSNGMGGSATAELSVTDRFVSCA